MFTFREVKAFNTIELVDGDEDAIFDYYKSLPYKFDFNFILFEGVIKTKGKIMDTNLIEYRYFRYDETNKIIHIEYYGYADYKFAHQYNVDLDLEQSSSENCMIYKYLVPVKSSHIFHNDNFGYTANYVNATLIYLNHLISSRETKIKHFKNQISTASDTSKTSHHKNLNKKIIHLSSDKIKYELNLDNVAHNLFKRHYSRYTESWTVRGHYRQLKDGSRIYIKPYNKGKGKPEKKTYRS